MGFLGQQHRPCWELAGDAGSWVLPTPQSHKVGGDPETWGEPSRPSLGSSEKAIVKEALLRVHEANMGTEGVGAEPVPCVLAEPWLSVLVT